MAKREPAKTKTTRPASAGKTRPASAGKTRPAATRTRPKDENNTILLKLYVAGQTEKSVIALTNLQRICEEHLKGRYRIEIIDLLEKPRLAAGDQILALPTLVREIPEPIKKIIGDLSNTECVLVGLDILPSERP